MFLSGFGKISLDLAKFQVTQVLVLENLQLCGCFDAI